MREDVADLADADDLAAARDQPVEQRRLWRRHRDIAPVGGAFEGRGVSPTNGLAMTRPMLSGSTSPRRPAQVIEPLETEMRLVRGDLDDRVGRGVADRLAVPICSSPKCSMISCVPDAWQSPRSMPGSLALPDDCLGQRRGKVGRSGKMPHSNGTGTGGDLPMPGGRAPCRWNLLRGAVEGRQSLAPTLAGLELPPYRGVSPVRATS